MAPLWPGQAMGNFLSSMVLFFALLAVAVGANILCPKRCSLVGEQCDCLGQPCCDTALSCSGGVCVGTPSVPNNDQLQQYRSALNPSLDGTNIFASAGRRFPKEVFDGRTYPAGVLEPAAGRPTRIFQETVEIGIPQVSRRIAQQAAKQRNDFFLFFVFSFRRAARLAMSMESADRPADAFATRRSFLLQTAQLGTILRAKRVARCRFLASAWTLAFHSRPDIPTHQLRPLEI